MPLYEETLKRRQRLSPSDVNTINSMNSLAVGYVAAGKLDQAIPLLDETLKLRKEKLGALHADTLISMMNLGARATESPGKRTWPSAARGGGHSG